MVAKEHRDVVWLTAEEEQTWREFLTVVMRLPWALDTALQRDGNLSLTEYYVLAMLSECEQRTERMSRLAALTNASLSRLSHLATRLERRGLIRRMPDPTNGRYMLAELTDEGVALLQAAAPGHVRRVRELVFDLLTPDQVAALHDISAVLGEELDHP